MESLLYDTANSVLSTPRIQQKRDSLSRADSTAAESNENGADEDRQGQGQGQGGRGGNEENTSSAVVTSQHVIDTSHNYSTFVYPPFGDLSATPTPLSILPPTSSLDGTVAVSANHLTSESPDLPGRSSAEDRVIELLSRVEGSDPETLLKQILESLKGSGPGSSGGQGQSQSKSTRFVPRTGSADEMREASHQLLEKFLKAAEVGDGVTTEIVKKALYEVLLLEFGSEEAVLSSLRTLLAAQDYMK